MAAIADELKRRSKRSSPAKSKEAGRAEAKALAAAAVDETC
jgi:hypothetical protein